MKQVANTLHTISGLLLLFFFCGAMVLAVISGAQAYGKISESVTLQFSERTCLSYIQAKVRNYDTKGAILLGDLEGTPALVLKEEFEGDVYVTYIYSFEGSLYELFAAEDSGLLPSDGLEIISGTSVTFETVQGGLLKVAAQTGEKTGEIFISLSAGGGQG